MNPRQRQAVLLHLIDQLRTHATWCGETHIQKSTYFLQELLGVPLDFNFIFYSYGPYSFDLNDELTALRCDLLLTVKPRDPYGATLLPSESASRFLERYPHTRQEHAAAVHFVAERLGSKNVADLEKLATALFVQLRDPPISPEKQTAEIHRLKPHVSLEQARAALAKVNRIREEIEKLTGSN